MTNKSNKLSRKDLHIGSLVVFSDSPTAQVYTVSALPEDNIMVQVSYHSFSKMSRSWVEGSLMSVPTVQQIEFTIASFGPLVSIRDL
jgi:hypothetical protein